jgi:hypothetical protein
MAKALTESPKAPFLFLASSKNPGEWKTALKNIQDLGFSSLGGAALGTLGGYGLSKLTSPSGMSLENTRKEELAEHYSRAINELRARIAIKKLKGSM